MQRDLFVTLAMLQQGGLDANAKITEGSIEVRLDKHSARFTDAQSAADWLAERAVMTHPECDLSKVWLALAKAAGGALPFASR